jgi:thioredoxin-like negative regulator of GroEL
LLRKGRRRLEAGDAEAALDLAKQSRKKDRSYDAMLLMGEAYCALDRVDRAQTLVRHVGAERRPTLIEACKKHGHELEN